MQVIVSSKGGAYSFLCNKMNNLLLFIILAFYWLLLKINWRTDA